MKKQYLKQSVYGCLALVLGLSTVGVFSAGAYAEPLDDSVLVGDPDELLTGLGNTDDDSVSDDSVDGDFIDGDSVDGDDLIDGDSVDGGFVGGSRNVGGRVKDEYKRVQKVVNRGEPFSVQAAKGASITVVDMSSGYWIASAEDDEPEGPVFATEDQITVEETAPGEYTITPKQAGRFMITLQAFVMIDNVLTNQQLDINLTVIATGTEAAKTITDIMNSYAEAGTVFEEAYQEYLAAYYDENATEEQKNAAGEEYQRKIMAAYDGIEQREINAFGDDSMAIWEAAETGKELTTKVAVGALTESEVDEEVKSALLEKLDITFSGDVKYYNVEVKVYADGEEIGTLKELTGKQTVVIDGFASAAAGYKRVFKVLAYHVRYDEEGVAYTEVIEIDDVEFDEATGSISFPADKFSTYLVAYKDVFAPSVNTGAATDTEGASATSSTAVSVIAMIIIVSLFGLVKFAKARK